MDFVRITSPSHPLFDRAFRLYETSFPLHERRTREKQEGVLSHPDYHYEIVTQDGAFAGILLFWEGEGFRYMEHFAIDPGLRGQQLGAQVLAQLTGRDKPVVLEIDPPIDDISLRRKGFYQRAGFHANPYPHVHPPYRPGFSGHPLVVMTAPKPWTRKEYENFLALLQDAVMADCKEA